MLGFCFGLRRVLQASVLCFFAAIPVPSIAQTTQGDSERFAEAQALRASGAYSEAITRLRDLLRRAPDANAIREELAYALLLNKQYAAAQYHFQILADRSVHGACG